ncbi:MAG: PAS domain S-box protein, partial [Bacillota bacterium]
MNEISKTGNYILAADTFQFHNLTKDLFAVVEQNFNIKWVSSSWNDVLGYTETELLNSNLLEFAHPEDKEVIENTSSAENQNITGNSAEPQMHVRLRAKNGNYHWLLWNYNVNTEENLIYIAAHDITLERLNSEGLKLLHQLRDEFDDAEIETSHLLEFSLARLSQITGCPYAEVWMMENYSGAIICTNSFSEDNPSIKKFNERSTSTIFKRGKGVIGRSWSEKNIKWINEFSGEKENLRISWLKEAGFQTIIIVPVICKGEVNAVMAFYFFGKKAEDKKQEEFLQTIADYLGNYIERKNTEEKLRKNEQLLSDTQKLTHTGSWEW